jgi:4-hydroxy-2-oxoheptanedioate aldolase
MEGSVIPAGKRLRAKLEGGEPVFGVWAGIANSYTAELGARAGYDYVCVDLQHGLSTEAALVSMFQAIHAGGSVPMARVAWNEPWLIMRALDLGAAGVILPLIDNAGDAARGVESCRYPPHGRRSFGPIRAHITMGSIELDDLAGALCIAMIETREALDNLDEIAATPGLDGLYIGPSDLSLALGLRPGGIVDEPGEDRKALSEEMERIREACAANGIVPGLHCLGGRAAQRYAEAGFKMITVGADSRMLTTVLSQELSTARGA